MGKQLTQTAPWPDELEALVATFRYRPGWTVTLHESLVREHVDPADFSSEPLSFGTTLDIITWGYNSYHRPDRPTWQPGTFWESEKCSDCGDDWPCAGYGRNPYRVHHYFPVPPATYNRQSWRRWLLECCLKVESHEACEFFDDGGARPYAPNHGPGNDPYIVFDYSDEERRNTSFRGVVKT